MKFTHWVRNLVLVLMTATLMACGGGGDTETEKPAPEQPPIETPIDNSKKYSLAMSYQILESVAGCLNGGIEIKTGIDENGNGSLDTSEVDNTDIVCHGTNGSDGSDGSNGTDGSDGSNGTDGSDGSNG
ncbi:DUF7151 family protein, partial [Colwellia piezophila]|uniref:DUF7151 family protein n=1 Tax=Colwellia piezophila TaxID=211668 RepID=UPI000476C9D8